MTKDKQYIALKDKAMEAAPEHTIDRPRTPSFASTKAALNESAELFGGWGWPGTCTDLDMRPNLAEPAFYWDEEQNKNGGMDGVHVGLVLEQVGGDVDQLAIWTELSLALREHIAPLVIVKTRRGWLVFEREDFLILKNSPPKTMPEFKTYR